MQFRLTTSSGKLPNITNAQQGVDGWYVEIANLDGLIALTQESEDGLIILKAPGGECILRQNEWEIEVYDTHRE